MKVIRINHLGIASKNPSECSHFFQNVLGLKNSGQETVEEQKVNVDMLDIENSRLEILVPTEEISPIAKYLTTKGSGIHHIALEVDNIAEWLSYLRTQNVKLIDENPRLGAHNTQIAFIHPHATGGILVELVQVLN